LAQTAPFATLCQKYRWSRPTGYKWLQRYRQHGENGLSDRPSGPAVPRAGVPRQRWASLLLELRAQHAGWGPKKLRHRLRRLHPRARVPSERTIARLLLAAACIAPRERRSRPGPELPRPARTLPRRANDVWTIDFKGYFHTGDGQRCDPLTVRDLHSRFILLIEQVSWQKEAAVRAALIRCFQRYGLPRVLRVDNGSPFANRGALNLSRLSVWWLRLGIAVEFTRPGKPQDNGAHEQMHRVLKQATAHPPAATLAAQAQRFAQFQREYNEVRPHEALQLRPPASRYRPSPRSYAEPPPWKYGRGWMAKRVNAAGRIYWHGRIRVIGRAFVNEQIGLRPKGAPRREVERCAVVEVYLGRILLGELHAIDLAGLRAARWARPQPRPATAPAG
jgi:transposase InsO family protein